MGARPARGARMRIGLSALAAAAPRSRGSRCRRARPVRRGRSCSSSRTADVDDQIPLVHAAPHAARLAVVKASAPRQFSTCTRQELGAMLLRPLVCDRSGVSMFRQPPISTVSPADFDQLEFGARLVGLDDARHDHGRNIGRADHGAAVVEDLDEIAMAECLALARRPGLSRSSQKRWPATATRDGPRSH